MCKSYTYLDFNVCQSTIRTKVQYVPSAVCTLRTTGVYHEELFKKVHIF